MCADLLGGAFHRREFLDLRELDDLLETSAGAVGNLDVAAGALDDLARDGEPKAGAGDILPPAWIDAEERLEHLAEKLRRNARPFVLDDHPRLAASLPSTLTLARRPWVAALIMRLRSARASPSRFALTLTGCASVTVTSRF